MSRRRRWLLVLVSALVAVVSFILVYLWWTNWRYRHLLQREGGHYPTAFSPDGLTVATTSSTTGIIELWDVASGQKKATWNSPDHLIRGFGSFSRDGRIFACMTDPLPGQNFKTELIDVATGKRRALIDSPRSGHRGRCFLDDGQTLRLVSEDKTAREVLDVDLGTGLVRSTRTLTAPMKFLPWALSDDGRFMPLAGSTLGNGINLIKIWDLDLDREVWALNEPPGTLSFSGMALASNGQRLAIARSDGSVEIWDIASSKMVNKIQVHSSDFRTRYLYLSPDGSKVASWGNFSKPAFSVDTAVFLLKRHTGDTNPQVIELVVHDIASGRRLGRSTDEGPRPIFSNDGRTLATSHDAGVIIRDLPPSR